MNEVIVKVTLNQILLSMLGRWELVDQWWNSPNKEFDGQTPNEVYLSGPAGRIAISQYVHKHFDGTGQ